MSELTTEKAKVEAEAVSLYAKAKAYVAAHWHAVALGAGLANPLSLKLAGALLKHVL